jgi:hypothetical protein
MPAALRPSRYRAIGDPDIADCAYVLPDGGAVAGRVQLCGAPRQSGSAYCPEHHALCHLLAGSAAEQRQLRAIAALAAAIGGKQGRAAPTPPAPLLRRLKRIERAFSRPICS